MIRTFFCFIILSHPPRPHHPFEPSFLFDAGIAPLAPFAFRGAMHLSDSANAADSRYADEMHALIAGLRATFRRPDMPVVFTQRTDLWEQRDFASLLSGLADGGVCDVSVSK